MFEDHRPTDFIVEKIIRMLKLSTHNLRQWHSTNSMKLLITSIITPKFGDKLRTHWNQAPLLSNPVDLTSAKIYREDVLIKTTCSQTICLTNNCSSFYNVVIVKFMSCLQGMEDKNSWVVCNEWKIKIQR